MERIKTHELKRTLPDWAKVVKVENTIPIYNMSVLSNVISWTKSIPDVPAIDYYGNVITFGELPEHVRQYVKGLEAIGIDKDDVITPCLPVSTEGDILLFAIDEMNRIQNNPNFLFLRNDFKTYTEDKGSKTLIILDAYLPFVIDYLEPCGIKNVVLTSLNDYLPEDKKDRFNDFSKLPKKLKEIFCDFEKQKEAREKMGKLRHVNFIRMQEVIDVGRKSKEPLILGPVDINRRVSYSYTSGTTGKPKCIVFTEQSNNALIELHIGKDTKDYVGDRCFQSIPLTHATGEKFCYILQVARGKTMVPIPIYNKETFIDDLIETQCNWITVAPSFYARAVAQGDRGPQALSFVTNPSSGGEPVTKSYAKLYSDYLYRNGCKFKFRLGGGRSEDGSSVICSYDVPEETRTNQTGYPVERGIQVKLVEEDKPEGKIINDVGVVGYLHSSSPASAECYLNDPEATAACWYYDENGTRWGITGDRAVKNPDGSYNILGRDSDSYVDKDGNIVYLFDIENQLEVEDPVIEWEISAFKDVFGNDYVVGQVVPKPEYIGREDYIVEHLCQKYNLSAVKIYDVFENNESSGKRDYELLKQDRVGYYTPKDEDSIYKVDFPIDGIPVIEEISKKEMRNKVKSLKRG